MYFVVLLILVEYKLVFVVKLIYKIKCLLKYKNWYEMIVYEFILFKILKFVKIVKIFYSYEY